MPANPFESDDDREEGDAREEAQPQILFQDDDGDPIKFHIQKDLPDSVIEYISELIKENGGDIIEKIPTSGYVLVDPDTKKGQSLKDRFSGNATPDRHVVPWPFVTLSCEKEALCSLRDVKDASPIFHYEDVIIKFYVHSKFSKERRSSLRQQILKAGGHLVESPAEARVIIADKTHPSFQRLVRDYADGKNVFVEPADWVKTQIATAKYEHKRPKEDQPDSPEGRSGPGVYQSRARSARVEYTKEDDRHLVEYLAKRIPVRGMPGRTGNKVYQDLCENPDLYPWAPRHTWQSWRNRFKQDSERFSTAIDAWVAKNPQPHKGKGQYIIKTGPASQGRSSPDIDEKDEDMDDAPAIPEPRAKRSRRKRPSSADEYEEPEIDDHPSKRTRESSVQQEETQDIDVEGLMTGFISQATTSKPPKPTRPSRTNSVQSTSTAERAPSPSRRSTAISNKGKQRDSRNRAEHTESNPPTDDEMIPPSGSRAKGKEPPRPANKNVALKLSQQSVGVPPPPAAVGIPKKSSLGSKAIKQSQSSQPLQPPAAQSHPPLRQSNIVKQSQKSFQVPPTPPQQTAPSKGKRASGNPSTSGDTADRRSGRQDRRASYAKDEANDSRMSEDDEQINNMLSQPVDENPEDWADDDDDIETDTENQPTRTLALGAETQSTSFLELHTSFMKT